MTQAPMIISLSARTVRARHLGPTPCDTYIINLDGQALRILDVKPDPEDPDRCLLEVEPTTDELKWEPLVDWRTAYATGPGDPRSAPRLDDERADG